MPAAKLRPVRPSTTHDPLGHVLAAVVADALDHRGDAAVADAEALARLAAQEHLAAGGAVERHVADDDVVFRHERGGLAAGRRRPGRPRAPCRSSRWRRPRASTSMPGASQAQKLCPAEPVNLSVMVPGRQALLAVAARHLRRQHRADRAVDVADRQVERDPLAPFERRARNARSARCRAPCRGRGPVPARSGWRPTAARRACGGWRRGRRPFAFQWSETSRTSSTSTRPTISSTVRKPSSAMISRSSSAMNVMKWTTCSGLPSNFLRSRGSCVAMPTGQVFRWHTRIMMQPDATSAADAKPNSSAPSSAATATSRPVFSWPSVSTRMRPRRSLATRICCVSASPSSHGMPACLIDVSGDAPVPPS